MHMFYGGSGFGFLSMLIPMLIWLLVVVGIFHLVSRWFGEKGNSPKGEYKATTGIDSAVDVLNRRYAAGELTNEEYVAMKEEIRGY